MSDEFRVVSFEFPLNAKSDEFKVSAISYEANNSKLITFYFELFAYWYWM
ncbi:hypothetical protein FHS10_005728 [Mucilaginibacter dorajii]|nr:hypothetical protein [Mucilaginibacter dorajii]MCS3737756.1 hypothetical protein [Mucilaginibacter dorajii]